MLFGIVLVALAVWCVAVAQVVKRFKVFKLRIAALEAAGETQYKEGYRDGLEKVAERIERVNLDKCD